jgi:hypothetical protein
MRIALLCAPAKRRGAGFEDCARALARGMEAMGHRVDRIDAAGGSSTGAASGVDRLPSGSVDQLPSGNVERLPGYEYVAVLAEQAALFGGIMPEALSPALAGSRGLVGKKGAAFLRKTGPFTGKALINLMKAMEREGMVINWSEVVLSASHAEALGKCAGV